MTAFEIAMLFVSALMGAGFVSGKEIYNFFGRYGTQGVYGIVVVIAFLIIFSLMIMKMAERIGKFSSDEILCPLGGSKFKKMIGWILRISLFISFTAMLSAGTSVLKEQFGINKYWGGLVLALLIGITVYTDIHGILTIFKKIVPFMLMVTVFIGGGVLFKNIRTAAEPIILEPRYPWFVSALLYLFYNLIAAIPVLGTLGIEEKKWKVKQKGGIIGSLFVGGFALAFWKIVCNNSIIAETSDLPMIYLAGEIHYGIRYIYAFIMIIAIYCSATNCLYGVQADGENKKNILRISLLTIVGYFFSLIGFGNMVKYIYPFQGVAGAFLLLMFLVNFLILIGKKK